ncbi:MAG: M48 family metalloprotease [Humidesulfovibrio sp.]
MTVLRTLLLLALLTLVLGCGAVTRRPDIDQGEVAAEASRMYEMVIGRDQQMAKRLSDLSTPLLIGNADLCENKTRHVVAMAVHNLEDYRGRKREAMESVYELDESIRVTLVGREGPAHIAGIREGDVILAVNDIETPRGMAATAFFRAHVSPLVEAGKPIKFSLLRKAQKITAIVQPVLACDYPVRLLANGDINAYATGTSITIYTGLLSAIPKDQEVGVVVAHELAHNLMGHIEKKKLEYWKDIYILRVLNEATGTNAGTVYANFSYLESSVDFEYEADYVGLYLAARAGLDYEGAPEFLRRLALDSPGAISRSSTHPKLAARYVAQEAAIAEIRKKTALGQPLIPEMKIESAEKKPTMKDGWAPVAVGLGAGQ